MQRLAYLFVIAALAAALSGCGESAETQAADEIRTQVDVARRHYLRAAGLMSVPTALKTTFDAAGNLTEASSPMGTAKADVLAALADAEKVLTGALSDNAAATDAGKAPANTMLAEVRLAIATYHGMVARERSAVLGGVLGKIQTEAVRAQTLAALDAAMGDLNTTALAAEGSGSALAAAKAFQARSESRRTAALTEVKRLTATRDRLANETTEATATNDAKRLAASGLRRRNRAAMGLAKLELDTQASAVEAEVEAGDAAISDLEQAAAANAAELELAQSELDAATKATAGLSAFIAGLTGRGEGVDDYRVKLKALLSESESALAALAAEAETDFADAVAEFRSGMASCDGADTANNLAIRAIKDQGRAAQDLKTADANSAMAPVLDSMVSPSRRSGVTARKGDIAFARAELARQLVALQKNIAGVSDRVAGMCKASGITAPASLSSAATSVADLPGIVGDADSDYDTARAEFITVANQQLSGPVNARGTKWLYQQAQARALLGRYRLLALDGRRDAGMDSLTQARVLVDSLMDGHEGDPKYMPIKQIRAAIMKIIRANQAEG